MHNVSRLSQRHPEDAALLDAGQRRCRKCGESFPRTPKFFVASTQCKGGITHTCKLCYSTYCKAYKGLPGKRELKNANARKHYQPREALESRRSRAEAAPYRTRATNMRGGLLTRHHLGIPADVEYFSVRRIMDWLRSQPNCECCGVAFRVALYVGGVRSDASPSLDRIIPARGYVRGNVAMICWRCNRIKADASADELAVIASWVQRKTQYGNELGKLGTEQVCAAE